MNQNLTIACQWLLNLDILDRWRASYYKLVVKCDESRASKAPTNSS